MNECDFFNEFCDFARLACFVDTARIVLTVERPSVCPIDWQQQQQSADLLLSVLQRVGNIDRQWRRQAWGTGARVPPLEFDARKILQPFFVSTHRPITHITALITVTVAGCCKKNFSHIRVRRPNARWLSLLDDFVTANFGTSAPRVRFSGVISAKHSYSTTSPSSLL